MSKHTNGPWTVAGRDRTGILGPCSTLVAICGKNEQTFTSAEMRANALHIVRCVNAHDDLLAALESIKAGDTTGTWARQVACDAIAKAKGKA